MNDLLMLVLLTLAPFLELRASIPYGILGTDLHWTTVFLICVIVNILLAPIVYVFLDKFIHLFLRIKVIDKVYQKYVEKTQKKIHKMVEKYGELGVAIFIGIPLPGSGVYSGALGSYLLGLSYKKFFIAAVIGVLIAGIAVTIVSLTGAEALSIFIKSI
ncbi:small multi-drug export protein [Candidatus Woesearchaeota archaeon]|nr:small multi-drug export protein [Candidatus Woesearchaeota archaeon]